MKPVIRVVDLRKCNGEDGHNGVALRGTNLEVLPGTNIIGLIDCSY